MHELLLNFDDCSSADNYNVLHILYGSVINVYSLDELMSQLFDEEMINTIV